MDVGIMDQGDATDALAKLGWTQAQASGIANIENAKNNAKRIARIVRSIRSAFIGGEIVEQFARDQLAKIGIVNDRIGYYIAEWQLEMTPGHRRLTASQIVTELARGQIDSNTARAMLHNLRYNDDAIELKLADAAYATVQTDEALSIADSLGGSKKTGKQAELTEKIIGLARTEVRRLKQMEPPAKLLKWLKNQVRGVDCNYVRRRMRIYGWDNSSIDKWLADNGCPTEAGEEQAPVVGGASAAGSVSPTPTHNGTGVGEMPQSGE